MIIAGEVYGGGILGSMMDEGTGESVMTLTFIAIVPQEILFHA